LELGSIENPKVKVPEKLKTGFDSAHGRQCVVANSPCRCSAVLDKSDCGLLPGQSAMVKRGYQNEGRAQAF
jgi:hypothetical protein